MANFPCNPRPFVPPGFALEDPPLRPPLRREVFVTGCYTLFNEDLAIAKLTPPVHKDDFKFIAKELKVFFEGVHQVSVVDIKPCPLGDAFVRFGSALDREQFLGPSFTFGSYQLHFVKHDEAKNARSFELDREAWVLMVGFPEDLRTSPIIAKSASTFGIMVNWDDYASLARVVVKVYLNNDRKIPDSVKVNVGVPTKGKSWTVPCYVLKKANVRLMPDEEAFVTAGPLHPIPTLAPRWIGPVPPADSSDSPANSNAGGSNMRVDVQIHGTAAPVAVAEQAEVTATGNVTAGTAPPAVVDTVIIADSVKTPEVVRVFEDRYEPVSLLCDEVLSSPRMKSVLIKDGLGFANLPGSSSPKITSAVFSLPGPRPVLHT